jgi:hypothetical protein
MSHNITQNEDSLRTEYATGNDAYMHYDDYSWQVGSVLIAGAFVFWGLLVSQENASLGLLVTSSTLVTLMMSIWLLYCNHLRQIYLCKLHRLQEIENLLGMNQHRRWKKPNPIYRVYGPKGHTLDALVYVLVSMGAPIINLFKVEFNLWLGLPALIVVLCLIWVEVNDRQLVDHLNKVTE